MHDLATTVILLAALQGAVLAPILWSRSANRLANRILAVLVAAVALLLLQGDLSMRFAFNGHPHLLGLGSPLPFLFGPLLYLYVIALTRPVVRLDSRWSVHLLPFAADILYMSQVFYMKTGAEKVVLARAADAGHAPASYYVMNALLVVQALVYVSLAWRALNSYERKIRGYFSDLARIDLRWLRRLIQAHGSVWSVVLAGDLLWMVGRGPRALGPTVALGSSVVIFLTGYVSLWQPELAEKASAAKMSEEGPSADAPNEPVVSPLAAPDAPPSPLPRYQRNRLDEREATQLATKLEALMAEKHVYRDGALTLPVLADAVGEAPHTLSQVLNVRIGKSFFVFVNTYRVEALKKALADPSKSERGVLELALEVGFNSKSTLNSFFKKHTGLTPTEFRARAQTKTPMISGT